jgi:hypothetical protein
LELELLDQLSSSQDVEAAVSHNKKKIKVKGVLAPATLGKDGTAGALGDCKYVN